jgi:hypothetical protein
MKEYQMPYQSKDLHNEDYLGTTEMINYSMVRSKNQSIIIEDANQKYHDGMVNKSFRISRAGRLRSKSKDISWLNQSSDTMYLGQSVNLNQSVDLTRRE